MLKKIQLIVFSLILGIASFNLTNETLSQVFASTHSQTAQIKTMHVQNINHYINLNHVTQFEQVNETMFFLRNGQIVSYNLKNKTLNENTGIENVTQIVSYNSHLIVLQNNIIIIYNENLDPINFKNENNENYTASIITANPQLNIVAFVNNNTLYTLHTNKELEINHNKTTTISLFASEIHVEKSLSINNEFAVITLESPTEIVFLKVILSTKTQNIINNISSNITKSTMANISDNNFFITLSNSNLSFYNLENLELVKSITISANDFEIVNNNQINILQNNAIISHEIKIEETQNNTLQISLTEIETLMTSSGNEVGRFNSPAHIKAISSSHFIVTDTNNNRIYNITQSKNVAVLSTLISNNESELFENTTISNPKTSLLDTNGNLIVLNSAFNKTEVLVLNDNKQIKSILNYENDHSLQPLSSNLSNITINNQNEIFVIDTQNNTLLKSQNYNNFTIVQTQVFNSYSSLVNAKVKLLSLDGEKLAIIINNNLHLLSQNGEVLNTIDLQESMLDADVEFVFENGKFKNNIVLLLNTSLQKIEVSENNELIVKNKITYPNINLNNYTLLSVAPDNGEILLFNSNSSSLAKLIDTENFKSLTTYSHEINLVTTPYNLPITILLANENLKVYEFPNYLGNFETINTDKHNSTVLLLKENVYNNFSIVLYNSFNTLKLGYINISQTTQTTNITKLEQLETKLVTVSNNSKIYKYPTLVKTDQNQAISLVNLPKGTELELLNSQAISLFDNEFYLVSYNNKIGFITKSSVIESNQEQIKDLVNLNYKVFNISGKVNVYEQPNEQSTQIVKLNNFTKINIESYNKNSEYTKITFINENNKEISGYIKTQDVWQEKLNDSKLTNIILIVSTLTLIAITIVIYIKIKKNKEN